MQFYRKCQKLQANYLKLLLPFKINVNEQIKHYIEGLISQH
jgi:hypothetical protein